MSDSIHDQVVKHVFAPVWDRVKLQVLQRAYGQVSMQVITDIQQITRRVDSQVLLQVEQVCQQMRVKQ